ncbi:MAG: hypothetical protein ACREOP_12705 [Thermodesulfobacteriota bacterium]
MAKKKSPLLELSTDIERDYILIDGEVCTIKGYQELSIVDLHWLHRRYSRVHKLFSQEGLDEVEIAEMQKTIDDFVGFVFTDSSKDVLKKLTEGQKYDIMMAFTQLFLSNLPERAKKLVEKATAEQAKKEKADEETKKETEASADSGSH